MTGARIWSVSTSTISAASRTATEREEVYKYLLTTNDAITIGSFFVDGDDDIGYKYMVSGAQPLTLNAFDSIYTTMTTVARERKTEIRQLLGTPASKEDKPSDAKKAAEDKPSSAVNQWSLFMERTRLLEELLVERILVLDGATGTAIQCA